MRGAVSGDDNLNYFCYQLLRALAIVKEWYLSKKFYSSTSQEARYTKVETIILVPWVFIAWHCFTNAPLYCDADYSNMRALISSQINVGLGPFPR